ncbi:MAG TPA: Spy/CpxP family protein refolding chaperone [Pyrinomonadaceae bacterium]|jgi:Spy/CpxP family protein refolding chaperone|nr:Spy/CpxP family protein refolding chaperone [Pyrinomonadaceae bacterium]
MKSIFTRLGLGLGLAAILSASAFAQTATPQQQSGTDGEGRRGREGRTGKMGRMGRGGERGGVGGMREHGMARRALRRLNLTDAQRGQLREIEARYGQSFKAQHQELRQLMEVRRSGGTLTAEQQQRAEQLRTEARANGERMHAEILALLTNEQRDQLKRMREEGEARRKERREKPGQPNDNQ